MTVAMNLCINKVEQMSDCGVKCSYLQFDAVYRTDRALNDFELDHARELLGIDRGLAVIASRSSPSSIFDLYDGTERGITLPEEAKCCGVMIPIMQQLAEYQRQVVDKLRLAEDEIERFLISNYMIPCCEMNARMNGSFREF
jgi:hypothetical protein